MPLTTHEKAQILSGFHLKKAIIIAQICVRHFKLKSLACWTGLFRWEQAFIEFGNIAHKEGNGRTYKSEETIEQVRQLLRDSY